MRIIWDESTRGDWQTLLARAAKSNLLNTWAYAHAMRLHGQLMTRFGVIEEAGKARGLIEIQEAGLGKLVHALTLHRGPLWLDEAATPAEWEAFMALYTKTFPRRLGRMHRFLPEMEDTPQARALVASHGFKRSGEGYKTYWLDLRPEADELRKGLNGKWRNQLNRSEKSDLSLEEDFTGARSQWLVSRYGADKQERGYGGPRPKLVEQLITDFSANDEAMLLLARSGETPVAGILILQHGSSATYQIGWSGPEGRETRAHYFLLWQAIVLLKARGIAWFDLGGVSPDDPDGVTHFKKGLGGTLYETVGLYK